MQHHTRPLQRCGSSMRQQGNMNLSRGLYSSDMEQPHGEAHASASGAIPHGTGPHGHQCMPSATCDTHWKGSIPRGTGPGDPSIVSPTLTGVFIGGGAKQTRYRIEVHAAEGPQRVDRAVSSPLSIISLGDVGGDGGVTDRATRGACSAGSGSLAHYLTGPETAGTPPLTVQ